ncbi:MAG TPA: hypothetical protein DC014_01625 [Treponema sp.]|nr:hypothetical protein [Treponema sp.]
MERVLNYAKYAFVTLAFFFVSCTSFSSMELNYSGTEGKSPSAVEPTLQYTMSVELDRLDLESRGYRLIGQSHFTHTEYSASYLASQVRELAMQKGAVYALYGGLFREEKVYTEYDEVRVLVSPKTDTSPAVYNTIYRPRQRVETYYDYYAYLYVPLSSDELAATKIGVAFEDLSTAQRMALRRNTGAYVRVVYVNGPAFAANLVMGDIIIRLNGVDIVSSSDLQRLLDGLVRGQSVQVTVLRDGREINLMMISE